MSRRIDTHYISTIHGRDNTLQKLTTAVLNEKNGISKDVLYYNNNKAVSLYQTARAQFPGELTGSPYIHNIIEPGINFNRRFTNQTETQQFNRRFDKSKAVNKDGTPIRLNHYTNAEFDSFDTSLSGSNQGTRLGDGIYLSSSGTAFAYAGKNKYIVYASIQKPFDFFFSGNIPVCPGDGII